MAQSSANREEGKELLGKMINTIYELDEFVPDEQKQLVEQLDEMHEQIENIFDAMATEAQDNQNSGVMSQYRLLEHAVIAGQRQHLGCSGFVPAKTPKFPQSNCSTCFVDTIFRR